MFIFLHIPKTGGSTFNFVIGNNFGITACPTNHAKKDIFAQSDLDFARKAYPRMQCINGHNLVQPLRLRLSNPFYATFVREPVARVISHYQMTVHDDKNRISFEESLKKNDLLRNLQVRLMAGEADLDKAKYFLEKCSFVGVTEQFDLSLHVLDRLSPRKWNLNYCRRRVAKDNAIQKSLLADNRLMDLARDNNKLDLGLYRFAVEEVFPKLCAKAGLSRSDKVSSYDTYQTEAHFRFWIYNFYSRVVYRQLCKLRRAGWFPEPVRKA